ncbi:hypothetical protein ABW20_dc0106953 [Dactylellina cionopaga]|nr:hypothetical protein ABW20_dc0106953 [Dactylellina cionopaga]
MSNFSKISRYARSAKKGNTTPQNASQATTLCSMTTATECISTSITSNEDNLPIYPTAALSCEPSNPGNAALEITDNDETKPDSAPVIDITVELQSREIPKYSATSEYDSTAESIEPSPEALSSLVASGPINEILPDDEENAFNVGKQKVRKAFKSRFESDKTGRTLLKQFTSLDQGYADKPHAIPGQSELSVDVTKPSRRSKSSNNELDGNATTTLDLGHDIDLVPKLIDIEDDSTSPGTISNDTTSPQTIQEDGGLGSSGLYDQESEAPELINQFASDDLAGLEFETYWDSLPSEYVREVQDSFASAMDWHSTQTVLADSRISVQEEQFVPPNGFDFLFELEDSETVSLSKEAVQPVGTSAPMLSSNPIADPDETCMGTDEREANISGSTLVNDSEGVQKVRMSPTCEPSVILLPNGTRVFTPAAGADSPGPDEAARPGVFRVALGVTPAPRSRKRGRAERQEEEENQVVETAPKRPRLQAPPLMPKEKFCLVFPQPAGYSWGEFLDEDYGKAMFLQKHLPVDNLADAETALNWWRQEWDEKGPHINFLMSLPMKTDLAGSAQRLIRYAQPLCLRMQMELGSDYYERLMDPAKKEVYGHFYFRMCMEVRRTVENKWKKEEEDAAKAKAAAAIPAKVQGSKRKRSNDSSETGETVGSEKKQRKETASKRKSGNDGKIVHERGRNSMKAEAKRDLQKMYDDPNMLLLQRQLLGLE